MAKKMTKKMTNHFPVFSLSLDNTQVTRVDYVKKCSTYWISPIVIILRRVKNIYLNSLQLLHNFLYL